MFVVDREGGGAREGATKRGEQATEATGKLVQEHAQTVSAAARYQQPVGRGQCVRLLTRKSL